MGRSRWFPAAPAFGTPAASPGAATRNLFAPGPGARSNARSTPTVRSTDTQSAGCVPPAGSGGSTSAAAALRGEGDASPRPAHRGSDRLDPGRVKKDPEESDEKWAGPGR